MRGRLYYTAKAKKSGKVMIKIHPCSHLCFCKCWTCFKEVPAPGIRGHSRGGGLGHWVSSSVQGSGPLGPIQICSGAVAPSSSLLFPPPSCLPVENVEELKPFLGDQGGLLMPTSSLGWEDQREHSRLL